MWGEIIKFYNKKNLKILGGFCLMCKVWWEEGNSLIHQEYLVLDRHEKKDTWFVYQEWLDELSEVELNNIESWSLQMFWCWVGGWQCTRSKVFK